MANDTSAQSNYERIVRALAAVEDPTVDDRDYSPSSECGLCGKGDPHLYKHELDDPSKHEESCPWRMARELLNGRLAQMTSEPTLRRAIEAAENALTDAHAHAPLPEVADWAVLASIAVEAADPILCPPDHLHYSIEFESDQGSLRALLGEVLITDHVWYGEPENGHAPDCPGCDLERRIRSALAGADGS